jgi:hypothetical protein
MEAGKNSVIYMGLILGPNKADDTCGRTTVTGTMDRGFTVNVITLSGTTAMFFLSKYSTLILVLTLYCHLQLSIISDLKSIQIYSASLTWKPKVLSCI